MLDGLLGRGGFSSKCKSLIKPTRARIEALRRRAEAKQRFLKEDLAKLLANGLDVNAYGRTEEFIAGLNLLSCYSFIDQSCEYILKQLSIMQKQGQCPEECRETVASLMFAAARFSELPELRDLRDAFQERYGNGLECFVNQVFVEKLASKPPTMEKRVKLLHDIATEFSLQWDSKGFKQRMENPSTLSPQPPPEKPVPQKINTPLTLKNPHTSHRDKKNTATPLTSDSKPRHVTSLPPPYVKPNIPPPYSKPNDHGPTRITLVDRPYHDIPLPKPRSMRRKYPKSSSSHDDVGSSEDARIVKRVSSSKRKERKGLQILFDDEHYHRDHEEKVMDKLLLHYSKKPSGYDSGKSKKSKSKSRSKSRSPEKGSPTPPVRSVSLPPEQTGEPEPKVYGRASSFQLDNQARHVHPKLPDYDDLAARFAALRGR